jgi:ribosomal protein S12 methylthiotransferase accessory factor
MRPDCGPGLSGAAATGWQDILLPLGESGVVALNRGWDLAWETGVWNDNADREHLSVRVYGEEVIVGPRWVPGTDAGCAGCAELRARTMVNHPLLAELGEPGVIPRSGLPLLPELTVAALVHLAERPLRPGELYALGRSGVRRHRVARSVNCPVCSRRVSPEPGWRPAPLVLRSRPASAADPTRGAAGAGLVSPRVLRERLVDPRFGPVRAVLRESSVPFAMSMAVLPDAPAMGHGRALTFAETEPVAILEAYERLGGFPFDTPVLTDLAFADVAGHAVDPATLGQYTDEQLAHETCRVRPFSDTTPMDWVWGHDLADGRPLLVPADIAFYQYEYRHRLDRWAARAQGAAGQSHFFHESSSGCAVGASLEEAALHALFELAERDAFLIAWHRALPLPSIAVSSITDPVSRALVEVIDARGFDVHVLVAAQDIDLPVVWVLALNRAGAFPASFSSAGSGADPAGAIRGALREVAQLVTRALDWQAEDVEPLAEDPWRVEELAHHVQLYSLPSTLPRTTAVLGGPRLTIEDAFPDWPGKLRAASGGDVRGALDYVRHLFAGAGLTRIVLVDQTTREHSDAGIAVARAVVPQITPMCFGHAQQRLKNLSRLTAALADTPQATRAIPYDPHPFP